MNRQINSPKEMARRLAFLIYAGLVIVFSVEMVVSIAQPNLKNLSVAIIAFFALAAVRRFGYCRLDFKRLAESFPDGCARDLVPEAVRAEVESLVEEFLVPGTDWVRRTEIRHRLVELEETQPEIIDAYSSDLQQVLAA